MMMKKRFLASTALVAGTMFAANAQADVHEGQTAAGKVEFSAR